MLIRNLFPEFKRYKVGILTAGKRIEVLVYKVTYDHISTAKEKIYEVFHISFSQGMLAIVQVIFNEGVLPEVWPTAFGISEILFSFMDKIVVDLSSSIRIVNDAGTKHIIHPVHEVQGM